MSRPAALSLRFQALYEAFEHYYYAEHLLNEALLAENVRSQRAIGSMACEYLTFAVQALDRSRECF